MRERHKNIALFVPHVGCPNRCSFCDQTQISGAVKPTDPQAVTAACQKAVEALGEGAKTAELAFFGGSFTAIPRREMLPLLEAARPFLQNGAIGGIRCSTRPDAIDGAVLSLLWDYGVTSIELGAQSMDDGVLLKNRRGHTAQDVAEAAGLIKEAGFRLGLQMMLGLPGDSDCKARETAQKLAALHPDEIRIYPTVVLKGTLLAEWMEGGEYHPPGVEETLPIALELLRFFEGEKKIPVIRLGLHASREVEAAMVGGCYHPAFRELCESRHFLEEMERLLAPLPKGPVTLLIHPADRSKAAGQHRSNLLHLARLGHPTTLREAGELERGELRLSH